MLPGAETDYLELLFGRAFLIAVEHHDRENALVFARAMLTRIRSAGDYLR